MKLRSIKIKTLASSAIIYRLSAIIIHTGWFWLITGKLKFAFGVSIAWNIIAMIWYWLYHYYKKNI